MAQPRSCANQDRRLDFKRLCTGDKVRLMRFEEPQHGIEQRRVADPPANIIAAQASQPQKTVGAGRLLQHPDERVQRQCIRRVCIAICFLVAHRLIRLHVWLRGKRVAKKVLVVEDNELNLRLFCDLLRAHDYDAEAVRDGREAMDRARAFTPDLIVMDIQMPYVTGLELTIAIRADDDLRAIPIMAVTAYAGKGDEERIRAAGADAYVSKPISLIRFIETVEGLVSPPIEA